MHVHVEKGEAEGKIWLEPAVKISYMRYFSSKEEKHILELVNQHAHLFKNKWNEYFSK